MTVDLLLTCLLSYLLSYHKLRDLSSIINHFCVLADIPYCITVKFCIGHSKSVFFIKVYRIVIGFGGDFIDSKLTENAIYKPDVDLLSLIFQLYGNIQYFGAFIFRFK